MPCSSEDCASSALVSAFDLWRSKVNIVEVEKGISATNAAIQVGEMQMDSCPCWTT